MKTVDAIDGEIRFTTSWGGKDRYVFIPDPYVSNDAGWKVTRQEAIDFVRGHLDRYRAEALAQQGEDSPEKIIILDRSAKPFGREQDLNESNPGPEHGGVDPTGEAEITDEKP